MLLNKPPFGTATFSKHFGLTFGMGRPGDYASRYQPNQYKDPKLGNLFYITLKKKIIR
jgi:hypothetical protein